MTDASKVAIRGERVKTVFIYTGEAVKTRFYFLSSFFKPTAITNYLLHIALESPLLDCFSSPQLLDASKCLEER